VTVRAWRRPELDGAAAEALAVLTLYATGKGDDTQLASRLLDDVVARRGGTEELVGGLISVCATLLVMLDFEAGIAPAEALRQAGRLVAEAGVEPRPL
jgi:hypothetical protein